VSVDPENPEIVYASDTIILKSTDGGKTFLPFKGDPTGDDYHSLWIDPSNPGHMISGVDQGVIVTLDGGKTWSSWFNQPIAQIYHVTTDNRFPYWVYGAQQDSGAVGLPSRTNTDDGIGMMQFTQITAGGESSYLVVDPRNPDLIYGSDYGGGVDRLDLATGQTQSLGPTLAYPGLYRSVWTMPLVFSRADPKALYFGNQKMFRTTDGGKKWSIISPDLSRPNPGVPSNLDPVTAQDASVKTPRRGVIYSIAPSPRKADLIWAGTDDGLVWVTHDTGKRWTNVTPPQLTPWSKVAIIEASHFNNDTAYLAVDRHRLNDYKPYIYVTHDGGKSWKLIVNGIPDGSFANVVREDPVKPGLLYAGTEMGVYVSFDDGAHWQSLQQNLPVTSVRDIDVHDGDLVIATHGRGFWIMDDVTALRQLDTRVAQSHAWLFKPANAYRVLPAGFTGTPLPADEPHAENPPLGAYIDYYLKSPAYTPVTLDIYDYLGNPVRHFSSATPPEKIDLSKINSTPEWVRLPMPLSASVGMHRFVWNLRYAQPPALTHRGESGEGLWVVPGDYTVILSVNGKTYSQRLKVLEDPRVKVFTISLSHQLKFAQQIESARVQVAMASHSIESLLKQLRDLQGKVKSPLAERVSALILKLDAIGGISPANPDDSVGVPPANLENLTYLGGALTALEQAVESADAAPTPDARTGFKRQQKLLAPVMQQWRQLQLADLPQMSAALQNAGLTPLKY
ncbi:MAG: WD40/YVTN/BNR-like repeat-containing protein, partial [Gammaproteobacteria bacterium]